MRLFFILLLLIASCFACEKESILPVDQFCWSCSTTITTQVRWVDGTHVRMGYPSTTDYTRNICDATKEDIYLYEQSGTDSTDINDGVVFVTVVKETKCKLQ